MWGGYPELFPSTRWSKARAGVEKDTRANRDPGSSAGGAGQEELLRGKKDVQIQS